jgi:SAM-dependent methyltransferase
MTEFDAAYFRQFYYSARTRVTDQTEMSRRVRVICAVLDHAQLPVRRILDAGCGIGLMQRPFAAALPRATYQGLEHSDYLCRRYGWTPGSIVDFVARKPYDLVVCYDVLQYLNDAEAARALANLARLSRSAVYVSALTREDWRKNCDRSRTDRSVHLRSGAWYVRRLERHFRYLGLGLWLRRGHTAILWELERARAPVHSSSSTHRISAA